ncbi:hypothetical protein JCGZ_20983 [Jatropha curcas]|uniref:Uncharacterized protein n=1 Tax=Jatropha curcas TaxID=180498 RepID=A0A067JW40_JATCU|nr:hypothetical protein JCGZ_20983 [Jatropha curcas]
MKTMGLHDWYRAQKIDDDEPPAIHRVTSNNDEDDDGEGTDVGVGVGRDGGGGGDNVGGVTDSGDFLGGEDGRVGDVDGKGGGAGEGGGEGRMVNDFHIAHGYFRHLTGKKSLPGTI